MKKFIYEERSIGKLILLIGVLLAVPLLVLPFYPEDAVYIPAFLIPALFSILLGLGIGFLSGKKKEQESCRGYLYSSSMTVLAAWGSVSYTHLDVYKRQFPECPRLCWEGAIQRKSCFPRM